MSRGGPTGIAIVAALAGALTAACARTSAMSDPPTPSLSDTELGLTKSSVFDTPTPPEVHANDKAPGEQPVLPRPYTGAPPRIPHAVDDFLPITVKDNACLGCHAANDKSPGAPTPIPSSHYTDYRRAPERVESQIAGARYVCVSCHVVKTDAPDLVDNRFRR